MAERYTTDSIIGVEDALDLLLEQVHALSPEKVALTESYGRILAQNVASDIDISPFDNSAMDGFALFHADLAEFDPSREHPRELTIAGELGAGAVFDRPLQRGETLRIMTGAPMPEGADTVVKIEDTEVIGENPKHPEGTSVRFFQIPPFAEHVRQRGEEAKRGEVLLRTGARISPAAAGLLASMGQAEVLVYRRPRVGIASSGTELVGVTDIPGPGQIRNSNSYSLSAHVLEAGGIPIVLPRIEDTFEDFTAALLAAVENYDFVITSGGAAEGDFDFVTPAVRGLGELFYNKVNMKPGKAQTFGLVKGVPIFGLPGNPSAASVGFEVLIRPALRKMQGLSTFKRPVTRAVLMSDIDKISETRRFYLRARVEKDCDNIFHVTPAPNQSSALLGALNNANCLLVVPEGLNPLRAGEIVACLRLDMDEGVV